MRMAGAVLLALIIGFVAGVFTTKISEPPTRLTRLSELAIKAEAASPLIRTEIVEEYPNGDILYVSMKPDTPSNGYRPIARVEIGYEGQILASLWNAQDNYYRHHLGIPTSQDDLLLSIQSIAEIYK